MWFRKKRKIEKQIEKLNNNVYELLNSQRERIFALREENAKLFEELKAQRKKEEAISSALMLVNSTKRETEEMLILKKNAEIERLKAFSENWQRYFQKVFAKMPDDGELAKIDAFNKKLQAILTNEQSAASATYMLEKMRLSKIEEKKPAANEAFGLCESSDEIEITEIKQNLKKMDGLDESSAAVFQLPVSEIEEYSPELPDLSELLTDLL